MYLEEFRIGHLYSVSEVSKSETGGGEGVEVIEEVDFDERCSPPSFPLLANGQTFTEGCYTHKAYHGAAKLPRMTHMLLPRVKGAFVEHSWSAFPYCRSVITIFGLTGWDFRERVVRKLDIANDPLPTADYQTGWDPCLVGSEKAGRAPLPKDGTGEWMNKVNPVMTCYKVVKVWFNWFGLKDRVEKQVLKYYDTYFLNFHRKLVCWMDEYHGLTMEEIRRIELETREKLSPVRKDVLLY
ncbi:hypothetical protein RRG08_005370 [Elysia crispata]|uniref:Phosphatidylinositol transfer protein N-terminal domain-containing protein n=1 Tax=Elysia crispata TaxID=231223 RepID=A0AAE1D644_9GAST|nr:hypothetical protein RRG08_005370 [Elysia crispata]